MNCGYCKKYIETTIRFKGHFEATLITPSSKCIVNLNDLCDDCKIYFKRWMNNLLDGKKEEK